MKATREFRQNIFSMNDMIANIKSGGLYITQEAAQDSNYSLIPIREIWPSGSKADHIGAFWKGRGSKIEKAINNFSLCLESSLGSSGMKSFEDLNKSASAMYSYKEYYFWDDEELKTLEDKMQPFMKEIERGKDPLFEKDESKPTQQFGAPSQSGYGAPAQQFGAPSQSGYGAPAQQEEVLDVSPESLARLSALELLKTISAYYKHQGVYHALCANIDNNPKRLSTKDLCERVQKMLDSEREGLGHASEAESVILIFNEALSNAATKAEEQPDHQQVAQETRERPSSFVTGKMALVGAAIVAAVAYLMSYMF